MQLLAKVLTITGFLAFSSEGNCGLDGSCGSDDSETSLMQVTQTVRKGIERTQIQEASPGDDVVLSSLEEEESDAAGQQTQFPSSPGCQNMGCYGIAPFCNGNENDCTSRGFSVQGYSSGNSMDGPNCGGKCKSGVKVICQKCDVTPVPPAPPTPAPPTPAPPFVAPPAPTTAAPAPTPAPSPTTPSPGGAPPIPPVNESELMVSDSKSQYSILHKELENATKLAHEIEDNISAAVHAQDNFTKEAEASRAAAVRFAQREELINQTIQAAERALEDAKTGKLAAANDAKVEANAAANAALEKVYYKKQLVEQRQAIADATDKLAVGNIAVHKAYDTLHMSRKAQHAQFSYQTQHAKADAVEAEGKRKQDAKLEVKNAMETAYVDSSNGRNDSQVPAWGLHKWTPP